MMSKIQIVQASVTETRDAEMQIRWGIFESTFGTMFLASSPRGISHLSYGDESESMAVLRRDWPRAKMVRDDSLDREFAGGRSRSLHVIGTPFQIRVWKALLEIPEGTLSTYSSLAEEIGMPGAARAVGNAVGANRISLLIPCHRVIRADGSLGGYRWGTERKKAMLAAEGSLTPQ